MAKPFFPCTQSWGEASTYGRICSLKQMPLYPPPKKNTISWCYHHHRKQCTTKEMKKKLFWRSLVDLLFIPTNADKERLLKNSLTFFLQAFSASWSWLKRSASGFWIRSDVLGLFSLTFSSPPLVNSASLKVAKTQCFKAVLKSTG